MNAREIGERIIGARIISVGPHPSYDGGVVIEWDHRGTDDDSGWLLTHVDNVKFNDELPPPPSSAESDPRTENESC